MPTVVMIVGSARPEALPVFGLRLLYFVIPGELGRQEFLVKFLVPHVCDVT